MTNSAGYAKEEIARLGRGIYERDIRAAIEPDHNGRFLAVDVTTGRYEIADDELGAFDRAEEKNPDGAFFLLRVGRRAAHQLRSGGRVIAAIGNWKVAMRGRVTEDGGEATLPVLVSDPGRGGARAAVQAVLDTGFTGHLSLPEAMVGSLALPELGSEELMLADGSMEIASVHRATVEWHGRSRPVPVLALGGDPPIGMAMLVGSRLTMDAVPGGEVLVEEIR